jgi:hypothetical protein
MNAAPCRYFVVCSLRAHSHPPPSPTSQPPQTRPDTPSPSPSKPQVPQEWVLRDFLPKSGAEKILRPLPEAPRAHDLARAELIFDNDREVVVDLPTLVREQASQGGGMARIFDTLTGSSCWWLGKGVWACSTAGQSSQRGLSLLLS